MSLTGQVALVTGASRGIGAALARGLAGEGSAVACLGRVEARLAPVVEGITAAGGTAIAVVADVVDEAAVREAVGQVEAGLGPIDLLVNNAGLIDAAEVPLWEADTADWWRVVEADVRGPFLLGHAVLPGMVARGQGRIVNINSGMGVRAQPLYSAYSVAKTALARMTEAIAGSLRDSPVCILDVAPGLVRTEMTAAMPMWDGHGQWTPVERVVEVVCAVAAGRLDRLSGRYVRADRDSVEDLVAQADRIEQLDARVLRLRLYGPEDPLS